MCFGELPSSLIMPPSIQIRFGDEAKWRKVWPGVVFMQNFWNFKAIPDTKIISTSIQSKLILKKFKWFLWRGFQIWWKLFVLLLTRMWRTRSDIWLVIKGLNFNLRVIENRFQSIYFICMNNDFVSHEKALPTDPDCLPLIRKGLIRHVI
jgi:hypothetical protein